MMDRVTSGQFKHWSKADLDREIVRYRGYLDRGLKEKAAGHDYIVPVEGYADQLDRLIWARATLE